MDIEALSIDPIGQFLQARHPADAPFEVLEEDRVRLAKFRHHFPGRSLQTLSNEDVHTYCADLDKSGEPPAEISKVRMLCQDFLVFAKREPGLGSGLLRLPDQEPLPGRDSHGAWLEERGSRREVPPTGVYQTPQKGFPWGIILFVIVVLGGGFWAANEFL